VLGLLFDTIAETVAIPARKVEPLVAFIVVMSKRQRATRTDLSSLAGSLTWVVTVCPAGAAFTASLYELLSATRGHAGGLIDLPAEVREDLAWWVRLLLDKAWTPIQRFIRGQVADVVLSTDSSSFAYGAWYDGRWIQGVFDEKMRALHINVKEAYIVTKAALAWGHLWKNQYVCFLIDNKPISFAFAKGRAREALTMVLVKSLYKHAVICNFDLTAQHLSGYLNEIPDALSRNQWPRFWKLATEWRDAELGRVLAPSSD
jgi:hypothetical protein